MPGPVGIETSVGPSGGGGSSVVSPEYTILVKTDNAGTSSSTSFTFPGAGTYDIEWGDGTRELAQTGSQIHDYGTAGEYVIRVTGGLTSVAFANGGDRLKLLALQNWGSPVWGTFASAYHGCSNLQITANDLPNSGTVTNFIYAWYNCTSLTSFPLIDTSSGTNFIATWRGCISLTSFPLIDTSSGTNFTSTWNNCTSLTSFPLISFESMTNGINCFRGVTLPTETWSQLLINTEANNVGTAVTWHGGLSKYNTDGGIARAALLARTTGWTITDRGAE